VIGGRFAVLAICGAIFAASCASGARPELADAATTQAATTASTASTTTTTAEPPYVHPAAPNDRTYPSVPIGAEALAVRLYEVEGLIHEIDPADGGWADLAHEQQMLYRTIGRRPDLIPDTVRNAPEELQEIIGLHLAARQSIAGIGSGNEGPANVPAWEIIHPFAAGDLRALYEQADADTGIHWSFLAAINLLETGFGRIDGLSTAGAQGPMQFLPTTWEEVSDGDINDPNEAIPAAARYLVRRGGPSDMPRALWGYNNSDNYVDAVSRYATLFRLDERSFIAAHSWEIHYSAALADLWFPVGYRFEEALPAEDYVEVAPWSAPPPSP
jgi:hypothetical protein